MFICPMRISVLPRRGHRLAYGRILPDPRTQVGQGVKNSANSLSIESIALARFDAKCIETRKYFPFKRLLYSMTPGGVGLTQLFTKSAPESDPLFSALRCFRIQSNLHRFELAGVAHLIQNESNSQTQYSLGFAKIDWRGGVCR